MAERVRRFRIINPDYGFDVVGDVLTADIISCDGTRVYCKNPRCEWDKISHWCYVVGKDVEELPAFAVGDAVRVKTGVTGWKTEEPILVAGKKPCKEAIGGKLLVKDHRNPVVMVADTNGNTSYVDPIYLEPWNDAEEWDGEKWVAKKPERCAEDKRVVKVKLSLTTEQVREAIREVSAERAKPAIVCLREDGKLQLGTGAAFDSTNEAFRKSEQWAEANPGKEYVVLQEKGSKRVEKPKYKPGQQVRVVRESSHGFRVGDIVTVTEVASNGGVRASGWVPGADRILTQWVVFSCGRECIEPL